MSRSRLRLREARPLDGGPQGCGSAERRHDPRTRLITSIYFGGRVRSARRVTARAADHKAAVQTAIAPESCCRSTGSRANRGLIMVEAEFGTPDLMAFSGAGLRLSRVTDDARTGRHLGQARAAKEPIERLRRGDPWSSINLGRSGAPGAGLFHRRVGTAHQADQNRKPCSIPDRA